MGLEALDKALAVAAALDTRGGLEIQALDMQQVMTICDYFVICHGRSKVHCQALAEAVEEHLTALQVHPLHREGIRDATWIILDYMHVVVHIFTEEARGFYDLRRLWGEATEVALPGAESQADD
jgi:ribosome-associated protein